MPQTFAFEGLPLCQVGIHSWSTLQGAVFSNRIRQKALGGMIIVQDMDSSAKGAVVAVECQAAITGLDLRSPD